MAAIWKTRISINAQRMGVLGLSCTQEFGNSPSIAANSALRLNHSTQEKTCLKPFDSNTGGVNTTISMR